MDTSQVPQQELPLSCYNPTPSFLLFFPQKKTLKNICNVLLWDELFFPRFYVEVLTLVPQNVTGFGDGALNDAIKLR